MTSNKDTIPPPEDTVQECCMCGDHGVSEELIQCRICQFRYQHRYCSNIYPKAQSYEICNWCLNNQKKNDTTNEKTQNNMSSVSSSLHKKESDEEDRYRKSKRMNGNNSNSSTSDGNDHQDHDKGPKATLQHLNLHGPSKKRMVEPSERSAPSITKRILRSSNNGRFDDGQKLVMRRTTSEMMIRKQAFIRNKVRRYKLLDEVTS